MSLAKINDQYNYKGSSIEINVQSNPKNVRIDPLS